MQSIVIDNKSSLDQIFIIKDPIEIIKDKNKKILISKEYWESIQETLYLLSIPGMREKIVNGLNTKIEDCIEDVDF